MVYHSEGNVQTLELCISLNSFEVDIVRVESSESCVAYVPMVSSPVLLLQVTGWSGIVFGIMICCIFLLFYLPS